MRFSARYFTCKEGLGCCFRQSFVADFFPARPVEHVWAPMAGVAALNHGDGGPVAAVFVDALLSLAMDAREQFVLSARWAKRPAILAELAVRAVHCRAFYHDSRLLVR